MSISGSNIFIGGLFTHVNAVNTPNISMINTNTQQVIPFNLQSSYSNIAALKVFGNTLYAGGFINYINGAEVNKSLLAINLSTDTLLNWNLPNIGFVRSLEANSQYIFAGGNLNEPTGGLGRINLFAIHKASGLLSAWAPNPNWPATALHIKGDKLYVGGGFGTISNASRSRLAAYDIATLSLTDWNPNSDGDINSITSTSGNIWVGGYFGQIGGTYCSNFAGLSENSGTVTHRPVTGFIGYSVNAIATKGCNVIFGGDVWIGACNGMAMYNRYSKSLLPATSFCQHLDGGVRAMTFIGNDLYLGGSFNIVNGKANATNLERIQYPTGFFDGCGDCITVQNGNWNNPATWEKGQVPPPDARVIIKHTITVTADASCMTLQADNNGNLHINSGVQFKVSN